MTVVSQRTEGFVEVPGGRVWYESAGEGPALLLLHGGPGGSALGFEPLMELTTEGYRVVRYDQLGSYRSDKPDDTSLWVVPRFVDEVEAVRVGLGLGRMSLLGQSWGSFLGVEYALHHQDNLQNLILGGGAASTRQCVDGMNYWRSQLDAKDVEILNRYESIGETDDPIYVAVVDKLYRRHLCRLDPYPPILVESFKHTALPVYNTMWGPNEFTCTGNLMSWERRDRLHEIKVPTLIMCGEFDEVSPDCSRTLHAGIVDSELHIFSGCSHTPLLEDTESYLGGFAPLSSAN